MIFDTKFNDTIVLIRVTKKCISNCFSCSNSNSKENNFYNLDNIIEIFSFIRDNISKKFSICISGYQLLDVNFLKKLNFYFLKVFENKSSNPDLFLHVGFNDILNGSIKLNIYDNLGFAIQHFLVNDKDYKNFVKSIFYIKNNNLKWNFRFYIIINNKENLKYIKLFKKMFNFKGNILFLENIFVEFNYNESMGDILKFSKKKCYGRVMVDKNEEEKKIFIESGIEIKINGDIKLHSNEFCNKGIKLISSIYKSKENIYNDFKKFIDIINSDKYLSHSKRCIKCINNPIVIG